jgi:hypothetical protein
MAGRLRGKGARRVNEVFQRLRRHTQRRQLLALASAMHCRLGRESPAQQLAPDLAEVVSSCLRVASVPVAEAAMQDLHRPRDLQ